MRSAGNFHPEWGYLAPAPSFMRTIRIALVATAIGAVAGAAVVVSLVERPGNHDNAIAAHALLTREPVISSPARASRGTPAVAKSASPSAPSQPQPELSLATLVPLTRPAAASPAGTPSANASAGKPDKADGINPPLPLPAPTEASVATNAPVAEVGRCPQKRTSRLRRKRPSSRGCPRKGLQRKGTATKPIAGKKPSEAGGATTRASGRYSTSSASVPVRRIPQTDKPNCGCLSAAAARLCVTFPQCASAGLTHTILSIKHIVSGQNVRAQPASSAAMAADQLGRPYADFAPPAPAGSSPLSCQTSPWPLPNWTTIKSACAGLDAAKPNADKATAKAIRFMTQLRFRQPRTHILK